MKRLKGLTTRDLVPGGFFYLSILILFATIGFLLFSQSIWDYDFWWHLATGRYIVQTGHLPHVDPFSFTSQLPENNNLYPDRERFILTQYWLAQVIFYGLYQYLGPLGIGLLRATVFLLILFFIYRALKRRGAMPYTIFIFVYIAFIALLKFMGERPVFFTLMGTVLIFTTIDDFERERRKTFYFLPLLMMVWANLHGGFILGDALIVVFVLAECVKVLSGKSSYTSRELVVFFGVSLLAIAVSGINPNGFLALDIAFSKEYAPFFSGVQEYQTPLALYTQKLSNIDYGYLSALFLAPVVFLLRYRKFNRTHLFILICLAVASFSAVRYTAYYSLIACIVLGTELSLWLRDHQESFFIKRQYLDVVFSVVMLGSAMVYFGTAVNLKALKTKDSALVAPIYAADFIKKTKLQGNMLNSFDNGGYLAWRLYPKIKTFIDTRALNLTVMREYFWMATTTNSMYNRVLSKGKIPLWERLLDHYKIEFVVFTPFDVYGSIAPLVFTLLEDNQWVPVYYDLVTCIFVRNVPLNYEIVKNHRVANEEFYEKLLVRAIGYAKGNHDNPLYMESIGDIFVKMGKKDDAIKAYEYAIKRRSQNDKVRTKLAKLKETEGKKNEDE